MVMANKPNRSVGGEGGSEKVEISRRELDLLRKAQQAELKRKLYRKEYNQRPDVKDKQRKYHRERSRQAQEIIRLLRNRNINLKDLLDATDEGGDDLD
jgi:hypothetical protein